MLGQDKGGQTMHKVAVITIFFILGFFLGTSPAVEITLLGPNQYYLRTEGEPDVYLDLFPGTVVLGKLMIKNGTARGEYRISNALISVNGEQVFGSTPFLDAQA